MANHDPIAAKNLFRREFNRPSQKNYRSRLGAEPVSLTIGVRIQRGSATNLRLNR